MKNTKIMTTLLLVTAMALSCGRDKILPDVYPEYSIVEGDTVKTRIEKDYIKINSLDVLSSKFAVVGDTVVMYKQVRLHTPPLQQPNLKNIKDDENPALKGKPLRYIALGGSLTAGVRDGGYFNEGIQTSYPALVARQMRLEKFEQPLFNSSDFNGYGRKVPTSFNPTGGIVPKFKIVKNNLGTESISTSIKFKNFTGNVDNYGVMNWYTGNTILTPINTPNSYVPYKEFFRRFVKEQNNSLSKEILNQNFDLISIESGWQEIWNWYVHRLSESPGTKIYTDGINNLNASNVYAQSEGTPAMHGKMTFLKELKESGKAKYGYFLNIPDMLDFPYFNFVSKEDVNKVIGMVDKNMILTGNIKVLPTPEIDSLLGTRVSLSNKKGLSAAKPLSETSILTEFACVKMLESIGKFNSETESLSKSFNFPIVDINSLYKKILRGTYITDDGVKVDGSYSKGNFFSTDGIYPTAFGQAVIANEVIKALNGHYKMDIPLISTREYLVK